VQNLDQQHGDQRRPYLRLQRVGRGADEGLDLAGLFKRLEKQLDPPSVLVDLGDGGGGQLGLLVKRPGRAAAPRRRTRCAAEGRVVARRPAWSCRRSDRGAIPCAAAEAVLDDEVVGVVLHAGDEKDPCRVSFSNQP